MQYRATRAVVPHAEKYTKFLNGGLCAFGATPGTGHHLVPGAKLHHT